MDDRRCRCGICTRQQQQAQGPSTFMLGADRTAHWRRVLFVGGPLAGQSKKVVVMDDNHETEYDGATYRVEDIDIVGETVAVGILRDDAPQWPPAVESALRTIEHAAKGELKRVTAERDALIVEKANQP